MNSLPLVSVITPTFNRPDTLPRTIDSVLNQTYPNVEIIVVDDNNPGSEGRKHTEEIMAPYANNPRVKYIKHEYNKNGAAARNTGVRNSSAKYIALLDDDDEYLPKKIEAQVELMESLSEEWGACYSMAYTKKENAPYIPLNEKREGDLYLKALTRELSFLAGSNILVKKNIYEEVGGFTETFIRNQDKEFVTKVLKKYKLAYSPVPGLIVYVHNNYSHVNFMEVDLKYYELFKDQIEALDKNDRKEFERIFRRDMFFHALRLDKNFSYCFKELACHNVPFFATVFFVIKQVWKRLIPTQTIDNVK